MIIFMSDFGNSEYIGIMKGIILNQNPKENIIDFCHTISQGSILEASFLLKLNYSYFPKGSTFLCVIDPGVGTKRKAIIIKTKNYFFIGPDNGLFWETIKNHKHFVYVLPIPNNSSNTFHGRDVFAKAINTKKITSYKKLKKIVKYEIPKNTVVRIDNFGNIITNIKSITKKQSLIIKNKEYQLKQYRTFQDAKDELFLIKGSNNTFEICKKNDSANKILKMNTGDKIILKN